MLRILLLLVLVMPSAAVWSTSLAALFASDLIMARSHEKFPEAMLTLQTSVKEHGYTVARVQRIDIGLTGMGYKTDKYRVVFVGKADEIQVSHQKISSADAVPAAQGIHIRRRGRYRCRDGQSLYLQGNG